MGRRNNVLRMRCYLWFFAWCFIACSAKAQTASYGRNTSIVSGVPWFDQRGQVVSARGANIIEAGGRYYLFGEAHSDTSNAFEGFNCYSSADLYNWKFERCALPRQSAGKLGSGRVGERPKVMRCPATGEFVMFMHVDSLNYKDQYVGYAVAERIEGPYTFRGALLFEGKAVRKWDMGTFQDQDGSGYILLHGADIYKLAADYHSLSEHVHVADRPGFESPAMFRRGGTYYFLGSNLTGWERNDNYYLTSSSLRGPWVFRGLIAPKDSLTWNSQVSFVLPLAGVKDTTYLFMGDRWSFPRQASAATYVWQPLSFSDNDLLLPTFSESWSVDTHVGNSSGTAPGYSYLSSEDKKISYQGNWARDMKNVARTSTKGNAFAVTLKCSKVGFYAVSDSTGGYARVTLFNRKGELICDATVDMYCKYPQRQLKFISPDLKPDFYTLKVEAMSERWYWVNKKGLRSGSKGDDLTITEIAYLK